MENKAIPMAQNQAAEKAEAKAREAKELAEEEANLPMFVICS